MNHEHSHSLFNALARGIKYPAQKPGLLTRTVSFCQKCLQPIQHCLYSQCKLLPMRLSFCLDHARSPRDQSMSHALS
jgi:hypothetical protein